MDSDNWCSNILTSGVVYNGGVWRIDLENNSQFTQKRRAQQFLFFVMISNSSTCISLNVTLTEVKGEKFVYPDGRANKP